jgi:hypothetical protein
VVLCLTAALLAHDAGLAGSAAQRDHRRVADLERRGLREFDSVNSSPASGTLRVERGSSYDGTHRLYAQVPAGPGNRFARGIFSVRWPAGTAVSYAAAIYLPADFYSRQQGDVDILRWDNWSLAQRSQDQSGVTIRWDHRLTLLYKNLNDGEYTELTPGGVPPLSTGAWHLVRARQVLGGDGQARNELWVDGRRVASSSIHNVEGRPATALRVGIVAVDATTQTNPLDLWLDHISVQWRSAR